MSKYTTGEIAKLCDVSVRTVQFYDTKGVLLPSELTEADLTKLRLICTLKAIGLSLDSIKGILESESSGKVLSLLLDQQLKQLNAEITQRNTQIETVLAIKDYIQNMQNIPAEKIADMEQIMENNKMVKRKFRKLVALAVVLTLPDLAFIGLWITRGQWLPFVIWFFAKIPLGILLAKHHFKDAAFICAECNSQFKPAFKNVLRTSGTTKARWLTCTACGHAGYCVEVYAPDM